MSQTLVLPGFPIATTSNSTLTLGPGIAASTSRNDASTSQSQTFIATKMGFLTSSKGKDKGEMLYVEGQSKRYIPAQRELVLGTIIARHAEGYRVDIGSAQMASLDALAFEGATKRSKPNLKVGTLVYARVSLANRDMEPEIECFDPATGKSDGFGELKGGVVVDCSLQFSRRLINPKTQLLSTLASQFPFETAIGLNGRIWVKAGTVGQTIALKRILEGVDAGDVGEGKAEVEKAVKRFL